MEKRQEILYLSQEDVIKTDISMAEVVGLMETCHREKGLGYNYATETRPHGKPAC